MVVTKTGLMMQKTMSMKQKRHQVKLNRYESPRCPIATRSRSCVTWLVLGLILVSILAINHVIYFHASKLRSLYPDYPAVSVPEIRIATEATSNTTIVNTTTARTAEQTLPSATTLQTTKSAQLQVAATTIMSDKSNNTAATSNGPITVNFKHVVGAAMATDLTNNITVEPTISNQIHQSHGNTTNTDMATNATNTNSNSPRQQRSPAPPPQAFLHSHREPYRDEKTKQHAQKCLQNKHGGVYIKHFRKASGSSLYQVIRDDICPTKTIHSYASEFPYFNTDTFTSLNTTVFITALRHPIDRIESLYWFEGRWPRTCHIACEAKKVKDNTTAVANIHEWIEHVHDQTNYTKLKLIRHGPCGIWQSVDNYYIRLLLGMDMPRTAAEVRAAYENHYYLNVTITQDHLEEAKRILDSFDLILIQDQIRTNSKMIQMMYTITGSKDPTKTALPEKRKGVERENLYFPMSNDTYQRLVDLNSYDIELYKYAVELSAKQVREWDERRGQKEDEESKETFFNVTESCDIPPQTLSPELTKIALGGHHCINEPWVDYLGEKYKTCMQHSFEPPEKTNRERKKTK